MNTVELMDGLTLLSVGENMPPTVGIFLLSLLGVVLVLIIGLAFTALSDGFYGPFAVMVILGLVAGFMGYIVIDELVNPVPTYKVTISDSVGLKEFHERYEIINTDGLIYTIKEKERVEEE